MQIATQTIKASNGTTDVVYTAYNPQAGDSPAMWLLVDNSKPRNLWPKLTTRSRVAKGGKTQIISFVINRPYEVTVAGVNQVKYCTLSGEFSMSLDVAPNSYIEFVNDASKLLSGQVANQAKTLEAAI